MTSISLFIGSVGTPKPTRREVASVHSFEAAIALLNLMPECSGALVVSSRHPKWEWEYLHPPDLIVQLSSLKKVQHG